MSVQGIGCCKHIIGFVVADRPSFRKCCKGGQKSSFIKMGGQGINPCAIAHGL